MENIKFKNLTKLISEVENEDKSKKYKITNDSLDVIIKYCYCKSTNIFILEELLEIVCNEGLLKRENLKDLSKDIIIDVLNKKNIKFSCVEDDLIINLSNKDYLEKQYRVMYYRKKISKCEKKIHSTLMEITGGLIFLVISFKTLEKMLIEKILIKDISMFSFVGNLLIIIALLWALIDGIRLKPVFVEKRLLKKKLGLTTLVDDSDFLYK